MFWLWLAFALVLALLAAALVVCAGVAFFYFYLKRKYLHFLVRIFQERPLFIIPRGQPIADAEEVRFPTSSGLNLVGCYLKTTAPRRKGVILFGLEFGSNRWACLQYCDFLQANGYDIFTYEPRSQGDSDPQPNYEPLQWVTDVEVEDVYAAVNYLRSRPDADPHGVGLFGISKGGSAGLLAASREPWIRCCVTDGIFGTHSTMIPYMRKWISIYSKRHLIQRLLPDWFYGLLARAGLKRITREKGCRFPHLERALPRLKGRPLLMIHGGGDTYIKPEMARVLYGLARSPKELWIVEGAKHNHSLATAGEEYRQRVLGFFDQHLAEPERPHGRPALRPPHLPSTNGNGQQPKTNSESASADSHQVP